MTDGAGKKRGGSRAGENKIQRISTRGLGLHENRREKAVVG